MMVRDVIDSAILWCIVIIQTMGVGDISNALCKRVMFFMFCIDGYIIFTVFIKDHKAQNKWICSRLIV